VLGVRTGGSDGEGVQVAPLIGTCLNRVVCVCVCSVWVPCVALPAGGSSAGSSPLCGSPVGGVLPCRVPVPRGICSSSCLALALTLSQCLRSFCHVSIPVRVYRVSRLCCTDTEPDVGEPLQDSVSLQSFIVGVNHPFIAPHLQSLTYCNTIAPLLRNIRPPHRPS